MILAQVVSFHAYALKQKRQRKPVRMVIMEKTIAKMCGENANIWKPYMLLMGMGINTVTMEII